MVALRFASLLALSLVAAATPLTPRTGTDSCNTGNVQCCIRTEQGTNSQTLNSILGLLQPVTGLLGGVLDGLDLSNLVGFGCSAITVVGAGGTSCTQQTVCCTGDNFNGGLISLNCVPINISL